MKMTACRVVHGLEIQSLNTSNTGAFNPTDPRIYFSQKSWTERVEKERQVQGLRAAIKDPETGKIYSGYSHQAAIEQAPKPFTPEWEKVALKISSTKSTEDYAWLGAVGELHEWSDERIPEELRKG